MRPLIVVMTLGLGTLTTVDAATAVTTSNANLRRIPQATAAIVTVIPRNTALTLACNGDWCRTTYKGQGGDVSRALTKTVTQSAPLATPHTRATPAAPGNAFYPNCTAVRAAGAGPIRRGQPGYSSRLDRDGDGLGCE
ncbi:ligand-binding protein SH3 [Deinococcus sp. Arct2-2]|uniref:excalibur calcium-binding domain-containing protein n=1 Tax=Deinococcus sp. Arct2-2 TaxID=2568653 RepID=UPI0010A37C0E|nr:excalibur calcium-binding domain-containing protein [Deinococcus sp. Arct2-2]THF70383.1 ligand-binding protein SH3 [Deinococcus sp. Arct2-2]